MFSFVYKDIDIAHKLDDPSAPTEVYQKHIHPFYEAILFIDGNVEYNVEHETLKLKRGDVVLIPSGKYHFATIDLSVPYERFVCKFPDSLVPDFIKERLKDSSPFFCDHEPYIVLFNQFDHFIETYSADEFYTLCIAGLLKFLTVTCHDTSRPKNNDDFIYKLINYIDDNLALPLTVDSIAEEFHYSRSFINREFKKHMRIPIMQFIRSKKIIGAHRLITAGVKKSDAAEMFGFTNYSTFYRAYQQLIGSELNLSILL